MATKKITELPFINTLSGSSVYDNPSVNSVVPVVLYGTTNQITVENFSKFTNLYAAQTGSQNIFTQNQWFNTIVSASTINVGTLGVGGNTTIAGTLGVTGNGTIGGNLAVAGRITAEEFYTEITTASVIYASGSTKFGDDTGDKHEFTGSINVSGSVIYNGVILTNIDANTIQRLQQATQSLQVATASLHAFTASQDVRNFTLSQITASFAGEIGGLEAYTASLKTAAIVSSSTQILNYNIFATTASNTFVGNQNITGSLSISAGEFNVITGSGNMTSSLIFDHTQNDGVTLGLRHNDRLSAADHTFNVNVWAAGVYTTFVRNGTPYSILNVEAFDDNKIYLYRDTRLYNKSLVIDNNLTVQKGVVIGSGSLLVNGVITGSILATNGVISSSNQLFELNQFTASQDSRNLTLSTVTGSLIGITNGLMAFTAALDNTYATDAQLYQLYQATRSIELTTGSLIGITNGLMAFTAALDNTYATDAQLYQLYQSTRSLELHSGSMVGVTNGLMAYTASNTSLNTGLRGEVDGIEAYTASLKGQAIVSSSTQIQNYDVFALNSNLYNGTGSIKAEVAGIESYTASLKAAAIVSSSTQVQNYDVFALNSNLYTSTGSLIGITNGLMAFTASLDNTFATDVQLLPILQATRSLELLSGSLIGITNGLMAFTAALDSTYATDAQLYQLYAETASIKAEIAGIEAYTASLKGAIEVSGQNVNVLGMITAQQFNVTYVSSSVMYQSGSTEFGDSSDDRHLFTGSLIVSGTLNVGTDINGHGRISFNESTNTLRIQSSKNGTDCTPISFWSQASGGGFGESMFISGSNVGVRSAGKLEVFRSDNARSGSFYTDNLATIVEASTDPLRLSSPERVEIYTAGVERARYTNDNNFLLNTISTSVTNTSSFILRSGTGSYSGVMIINHASTNNTSAGFIDCYYNTSYIGGIAGNGASNVAFNTSSDYRLKEDLKDFNGLNLISNLKVYDFKWKTDNTRMYGVLAHELQEIIPYVVNGNKDEVKEDGKIKVQVVDYSKIVPILIKSIQEQQDIIEQLKARIDSLENK